MPPICCNAGIVVTRAVFVMVYSAYPQRLKPEPVVTLDGTAEKAAEKVVERAKSTPRALKREQI